MTSESISGLVLNSSPGDGTFSSLELRVVTVPASLRTSMSGLFGLRACKVLSVVFFWKKDEMPEQRDADSLSEVMSGVLVESEQLLSASN